MQEPKRPFKSGQYSTEPIFVDKVALSKWYIHPECVERVVEHNTDILEDGEELADYEEWGYKTEFCSLQDILNVSQGVDPYNVIISIHRDRCMEDISVCVMHRATADKEAWKKGRDIEEKEYQEKLASYEKEKLEYDKWKIQQEIKLLENKLDKLNGHE